MRPMIWTALAVAGLDQLSKLIVVRWMDLQTLGVIEVWPPFITFRMAWNRGVNFGLFSGSSDLTRWLLVAVAVAISAWVVWWIAREKPALPGQLAAGLLVGGAIGNIADRLTWGAVADFLNVTCCGIANPYAFNIADISIFVGALGLVVFTGREKSA